MLRIFIAHVVAEAIRQTALVIAPDLHPAACLAVAVAAGVLVERALTHPNRRPPPPRGRAGRRGDRTR